MPPEKVSLKKVRIDYFRQPHPFRTLKKRLTMGCAAVASGWILLAALAGDLRPYSPGPIAGVHSLIESKCTQCHVGQPGAVLWRSVTNQACEHCHAGPVHHANQVFEAKAGSQPPCSTCHVEHGGRLAQLGSLPNGFCTQCHKDLHVGPGSSLRFNRTVTRFDGDHPEFRLIADKIRDKTPLKLNHVKHLRPGLPGANGKRVQMVCDDCHHPDRIGVMMPVQFERNCQSCHSLAFDPAIPEEAPHEASEYVDAFVRTAFSKYAGSHPGEWKKDPDWHPARSIASLRAMVDDAPGSLPRWLENRVDLSRQLLFQRRCPECHTMENASSAVPKVTPPEVPGRWYTQSRFVHVPHKVLGCTTCHSAAEKSTQTSDILLPGIKSCTSCHNDSDSGLSRCTRCHLYHPRDAAAGLKSP
jgi:hypothetical protein